MLPPDLCSSSQAVFQCLLTSMTHFTGSAIHNGSPASCFTNKCLHGLAPHYMTRFCQPHCLLSAVSFNYVLLKFINCSCHDVALPRCILVLLLCYSYVVECLITSTMWFKTDNHWLQTVAEKCFVYLMLYIWRCCAQLCDSFCSRHVCNDCSVDLIIIHY